MKRNTGQRVTVREVEQMVDMVNGGAGVDQIMGALGLSRESAAMWFGRIESGARLPTANCARCRKEPRYRRTCYCYRCAGDMRRIRGRRPKKPVAKVAPAQPAKRASIGPRMAPMLASSPRTVAMATGGGRRVW